MIYSTLTLQITFKLHLPIGLKLCAALRELSNIIHSLNP